MKVQTYFLSIFLFICLFINGQTTSIDDYNIYKTTQYDLYSETVENQTYEIKRKLSDSNTNAKLEENVGFTTDFFKSVLSLEHYNILKNNRGRKSRFSIRYIINESGNSVYACALYIPKGLVVLSDEEVTAILSEAMTHSFNFINKPNNINNFYFQVIYNVRI